MPSISAPLIAAGVGAAGSVASGLLGSSAAKDAANTQAAAADRAGERQMQMFDKVSGFLQPYRDIGTASIPGLSGLLGLNGASPQSSLENLPGYKFVQDQGLKSTQNSYAAQGLGQSGAALKGAAQFSTGLANATYGDQINRLLATLGIGQNAAAMTGNAGTQAVTAANGFLTSGAAASAAGTVGSANSLIGAIGGLGGAANNFALINALGNNGGLFGNSGGQSLPQYDPLGTGTVY